MPIPKRLRPALLTAAAALLVCFTAPGSPEIRPAAAGDPAPAMAGSDIRANAPREEADAAARERREQNHELDYFRTLAGGDLDSARVARMFRDVRAARSEPAMPARAGSAAQAQAVNSWQLAGPVFSTKAEGGQLTGRVRDIDAINVRALAASGGLWKFDIFGGIAMCDSVPASWFGSFATSPSDPNVILLGTGEYRRAAGSGMYRTTDGGVSWLPVSMSPVPSTFGRIRWSPDGTAVYAATDQGFYRSTDGGQTWTRTLTGHVSDVAMVPSQPLLVLVSMDDTGVFRSVDGGVTWGQLVNGGAPVNPTGIGTVTAAWVSSSNHVWIWAAFNNVIWRSKDDGATWSNVTPNNFTIGNSGYGPVISVCPADPTVVLYGDVPFCRSADGGDTWTKDSPASLHADYHVFAWDADGMGVWAGHDGGWSHSLDRGLTWSLSSNAMPISQFYSIDCEKTELGVMIGGTQDNGVLFTNSPTLDWTVALTGSFGGDSHGGTVDLYNPSQMWANNGENQGALTYPRYHTTDAGATWQQVDNGFDPTTYAGTMCTDNVYPVRVFSNTDYWVYETVDDGATWIKSNATAFPSPISAMTVSSRVNGGAVIYAALSSIGTDRLYVRDNGSWNERSFGLPAGRRILKVVPHPWVANADEAWAILSGVGSQVWHTTNRGASWTDVTGDLPPGIPVSDFVPNPRHPGEWYVGSMLGVFRTLNGGVNWEHWTNGMPPYAIVTAMSYIDLTGSGGPFSIVAATYGRSVWKRDVAGGDAFPVVDVCDAYQQEGDAGQSTAFFRVTLSQPSPTSVIVDWATEDSTATVADGDYVASSNTLNIPAGSTEGWITVPINGDTKIEPDEAFKVVLSNPVRALIGHPGVGTILDDDSQALACNGQWGTNGSVSAIAASATTVYVGGSFSSAGPPSGSAVVLDAASAQPVAIPKTDGVVLAEAKDGSGGWYIGGKFTHVGGEPRWNLAHVLADGSVDAWNPVTDDYVQALAVGNGVVYVGGRFTQVGGSPRHYLAAVQVGSNVPTTWDPEPDDQVLTLALSGTTLYVGGSFTHILGAARSDVAAIYTGSGTLLGWNPGADQAVSALLIDGGTVYAGGSFTNIGGAARNYVAALDPSTGNATAWDPAPDSYVFTLAAQGGVVYAGGTFANIGGAGRSYLAALDSTSGQATGWAPEPDGTVLTLKAAASVIYVGGTYTNIGGAARSNLAAVDLGTGVATGWDPTPNTTVEVVDVLGSDVFAGGNFTSVVSQPRANLAAFDIATGALLPWSPDANGSVSALLLNGSTLYTGGSFSSVGGQSRSRIAALDGVSGQATTWNPGANGTVRALLRVGTYLCAGGSFSTLGGQPRARIGAVSLSNGAPNAWNPTSNGTVDALATDGTYVYAGGAFSGIGGAARPGLAQLSETTGAATPWNPAPNNVVRTLLVSGSALFVGGDFTQIAGLTRPRLVLIDLSTSSLSSWAPSPNGSVTSLAVYGTSEIYAGGAFTQIGGQPRAHLALMRPATSQVSGWAPAADGDVNALATDGTTLWAGGLFTGLAGTPQAHFGCLIPLTSVDVPAAATPVAFTLHLSPNPSVGRVGIDYTLPEPARVTVAIYDLQGRRVGSVLDANEQAGPHHSEWNGSGKRDVVPGVYFVRVTAGSREAVRRFVIL